jgi:hypothetical protein
MIDMSQKRDSEGKFTSGTGWREIITPDGRLITVVETVHGTPVDIGVKLINDAKLDSVDEVNRSRETDAVVNRAKDLTIREVERRMGEVGLKILEKVKVNKQRGNIENIIAAWGAWAGSFDKCVDALSGKEGIEDPKALCAWLHHEAEGTWPGEKK